MTYAKNDWLDKIIHDLWKKLLMTCDKMNHDLWCLIKWVMTYAKMSHHNHEVAN